MLPDGKETIINDSGCGATFHGERIIGINELWLINSKIKEMTNGWCIS